MKTTTRPTLATLLATALPLALLGFLALLPTPTLATHNSPESLKERIAPEGKLNIVAQITTPTVTTTRITTESINAAIAAATEAGAPDGILIYQQACVACHTAGIAGSPRIGDAQAWRARIAQGMTVLVKNAINGYQGQTGVMPPRGGNANLTDAEVAAAVRYIVNQSQ